MLVRRKDLTVCAREQIAPVACPRAKISRRVPVKLGIFVPPKNDAVEISAVVPDSSAARIVTFVAKWEHIDQVRRRSPSKTLQS